MSTVVKTQVELDAALAAGKTDVVIDALTQDAHEAGEQK